MARERRALATRVFPLMAAECRRRRVAFTDVDLRWGVTEAESRNGRTLEICLGEIDRARLFPPFFIGMIGERYGWVATPDELAAYWDRRDSTYRERIEKGLASGTSATELEMRLALEDNLGEDARARSVRVFLRDRALTDQFVHEGVPGYDEQQDEGGGNTRSHSKSERLGGLKEWLASEHPRVLREYHALDEFVEVSLAFLLEGLDRLFPDLEELSPRERARLAHQGYGASRLVDYVTDQSLNAAFDAAVAAAAAQEDPRAGRVWVSAPSGYGKSALLASYEARQSDALVIAHYVGVDGDRSLSSWRDRVLDALTAPGENAREVPEEDEARWEAMSSAAAKVARTRSRDVVLVLDAVNALQDRPSALTRLGDLNVYDGVALVVSATPEITPPSRSTWSSLEVPALVEERRREIIARHLARHGKGLDDQLTARVAGDPASAVPLFLRLVLDEVRLHADHDSLNERVACLLATREAGTLFETVLAEMDEDFASTHPGLASRAGGLLAVSRHGLTYPELRTLLGSPDELAPDELAVSETRLPDLVMSPLWERLGVFSLLGEGRLTLMHAALAAPLLDDEHCGSWREDLISFSIGDTGEEVAERAHQMRELGDRGRLVELLSDPDRVITLLREDPPLLALALVLIGAERAKTSPEVAAISASWRERGIRRGEPLEASHLDFVGHWLTDLNFSQLAEEWLILVLDWRRAALSPNHLDIMRSLNNLALLYRVQGRLTEAEPLLLETLRFFRAAQPVDYPNVARSLNNLAVLYSDEDRFAEAEPLLLEALEIDRATFVPGRTVVSQDLNNLARVYREQGRFDEAEPLYLEALRGLRAALPPSHPFIATSLNNLALLYLDRGRAAEAEPLLVEALENLGISLPRNHPNFAASLNNLALVYREQGRVTEAEPLLLEALNISLVCLPITHPNTRWSLVNLAQVCQELGRSRDAKRLRRAITMIDRKSRHH